MKPVMKLQGNGRKILVVDDDLAIRVLLDAVLKRMGFTVMQAPDGRRALELLERYQYDLILLDLMMPVVDGYQVLEKLDPRMTTPVLVFTAAADSPGRVNGRVCASIRKPFDLELFVNSIAGCLGETIESADDDPPVASSAG